MKKLITAVIGLAFLFGGTVFAQGFLQPDYSLMSAPALKIEASEEFIVQDFENFEPLPVAMPYSRSIQTSEDEMIFAYLDAALSPENIANQTVNYSAQSDLYYISVTVPINVEADTTVGEKEEYMNRIYNRFVVENPEYFYLVTEGFSPTFGYRYGSWYCTLPAIICPDFPEFDGSYAALSELKNKYELLTEKTDEIAEALYFEGMTDLDKLLLAHDYLTDNCAYYFTYKDGKSYYGDGYSYNSYGALINEKAVCQGYTFAYTAILVKLGFSIENIRHVVSNNVEGFNHIWNFVKLGEKWYHIDATWDDPTTSNYDMNDEASQMTFHNHFLISDATNTAIRNEAGHEGFIMEIYGYEDLPGNLPSDTAYESGYIFNDPVNNSLRLVPGKIEYENGEYKKYNGNTIMFFNFDSLKALSYMVSQPGYNLNNELTLLVYGAKQRTPVNTQASMYFCYYDKNERLIKAEKSDAVLSSFGQYAITIEPPQKTKKIKIITVKNGTIIPLANVPIVK